VDEVKVIPKNGANNLLFDNLAIFLYSYSNQPGRPNQQHRIDVTSRLFFEATSNIFFCLRRVWQLI
jgi:hypothetical protein